MKIPDRRIDGQPYELFMFARRHGIELELARAILNQHGADRAGSDAAAMALKDMTLDMRNSLTSDEL